MTVFILKSVLKYPPGYLCFEISNTAKPLSNNTVVLIHCTSKKKLEYFGWGRRYVNNCQNVHQCQKSQVW